jgi:hypothetical protein
MKYITGKRTAEDLLHEVGLEYKNAALGIKSISTSNCCLFALQGLTSYESLSKSISNTRGYDWVNLITAGTNVIDVNAHSKSMRDVFLAAHIAVCCELYEDIEVKLNDVNDIYFTNYAQNLIDRINLDDTDALYDLINRIHRSDAARIIQILSNIGIYRDCNVRQLSLGAGNAEREIFGLHEAPKINNFKTQNYSDSMIIFGKNFNKPENIIIIDNDKKYSKRFKQLNSYYSDWVKAINGDIYDEITNLSKLIKMGKIKSRNLITCIRLDPEMIQDAEYFIMSLASVINHSADLIITIGAGNNLKEFSERIKIMNVLFEILNSKKLKPIRINLHTGNNLEEHWCRPSFGTSGYSSYELIFCKLKKSLISQI